MILTDSQRSGGINRSSAALGMMINLLLTPLLKTWVLTKARTEKKQTAGRRVPFLTRIRDRFPGARCGRQARLEPRPIQTRDIDWRDLRPLGGARSLPLPAGPSSWQVESSVIAASGSALAGAHWHKVGPLSSPGVGFCRRPDAPSSFGLDLKKRTAVKGREAAKRPQFTLYAPRLEALASGRGDRGRKRPTDGVVTASPEQGLDCMSTLRGADPYRQSGRCGQRRRDSLTRL